MSIQPLPREIQLLEQASAFLAECQDLDEVKSLRDKAEAIRLYQKKIGASQRSQNAAAEIKLRAERRLGELLRSMPKHNGDPRSHDVTRLRDLEIGKMESSRCQVIAAVPESEFNGTIAEAVRSNRELTSREMIVKGRRHRRAEAKWGEMERVRRIEPAGDDPERPRSWEIIHGHCVTVMGHPRYWTPPHESRQAPAISGIRLIFADPPYNERIAYGPHYDDDQPEEEYLEQASCWLRCCHQALTDDGSLWLLINHEWAWRLCGEAIRAGFQLRQWITWFESFGANCTRKFNRCSRALLWLAKDRRRFVFHDGADEIRRRSDREAKYGDKRADPGGKLWDDVWGINPAIPRLVENAAERVPGFPTQLPLALLRPIIACASDEGDLVLDPFAGSGTTGAACIEMGRRFIGIELSERFAELARMRLSAHEKGASHAIC
jgi:site-specific DNA-methyltransferase (adenine-specific)